MAVNDEKFRIGVSSGFLTPGQNNVFSLPQKLANVITWGVNYTQVDIQTTAELSREDFRQGMTHIIKSLKMRYGMHAEINQSVGLEWAVTQTWKTSHMKLNEYLDLLYNFFYEEKNGKETDDWRDYLPEYIDFHISQAFPISQRTTREELFTYPCSTPWGKSDWDESFFKHNPLMKHWFMVNILPTLFEKQSRTLHAYDTVKATWMARHIDRVIDKLNNGRSEENKLPDEIRAEILKITEKLLAIEGDDIAETEKKVRAAYKKIEDLIQGKIDEVNKAYPNRGYPNKIKEQLERMKRHLNDLKDITNEAWRIKNALDYFDDKWAKEGERGKPMRYFEKNKKLENNDVFFSDNGNNGFLEELYKEWLEITSKNDYRGTISGEQYAYAIIAKYLEYKYNDNKIREGLDDRKDVKIFWDTFMKHEASDGRFVERSKDWETMEGPEKDMTPDPKKRDNELERVKFVEKDGTVNLHSDVVAMVAAFYIINHFTTSIKDTDYAYEFKEYTKRKGLVTIGDKEFYEKSPAEKLAILERVRIAFENPHLIEGLRVPGTQRIVKAIDMEKFARAAEEFMKRKNVPNRLYLLLDFGWWQANGMDPIEQVKSTSKKFGEYVKAIQIHYAYAGGAHYTIDIGSKLHERMYEWLWELSNRGMINVPIVFERGGGQNPMEVVRTSIFAMRTMRDELLKNTPPDKLPPSFFGFSDESLFSLDRQRTVVKEHLMDPMKGMLETKEFDHTFIGGHAITGKGKRPEEWAKERFK